MMNIEKVMQLMQEVPDYQVFLTVDELNASMHRLAEQHPDAASLQLIGESREGTPIHAMKIGDGRRVGLLYANPHPNEPIGSMMLEFLSERLAKDAALRRELDYTWYIIKCIDVDGTRLNEGWFKGPFSVTHYARNFFRPPGRLQVEWTFPIDYKNLHFHSPLPETQALMKIIEQTKPDFIYALHNSGFGGVYAYVSHDIPAFYPDFYKLVEDSQLPLHAGEAEVPYVKTFSRAIFGEISISEAYDFLEANGAEDPAAVLNSGESSVYYASQFKPPMSIVCEMPYFHNPAINDDSPSDMLRRDAILAGLAQSRAQSDFFREHYAAIRDLLTVRSPFLENIEDSLENQEEYFAAQENWAKTDPSLEGVASVAEKFDSLQIRRFYQLLSTGMFVRLIKTEIQVSGEKPALLKALRALESFFDKEAAVLEQELSYEAVPIQKLVRVQMGAGLLYADYVK